MTRKLLSITMWLVLVAFAVPASAALITVIHALPALPGAVPSSNPVDVAIDGTGSVFKKTVNLLSIESIPGELIEGDEPPPAAFSTCCAFAVAIQVSQNQCQSLGGTYIGDVDPSKNPCQGTPFFSFGAQFLDEAPHRETLFIVISIIIY